MAVACIRFQLRDVVNMEEGGLRSLGFATIESSLDPRLTNELPYILHALGRKGVRLPAPTNNKFTYTFPFKLS